MCNSPRRRCGNLLDPLEPDEDAKSGGNEDGTKATGWLINPRCKLDGATPEKRKTKHMFLKLDALKDPLVQWFLQASKEGSWANNAQTITQSWIDRGLMPRAITRDINWGVPVPTDVVGDDYAEKVFYVWFDACIGA